MRVVLTGGSGKLGRACVADLVDHGYDVVNVDLVPPTESLCPFVRANLEDFGAVIEVLAGVDDHGPADAVVHLAAIPAAGMAPNATTFRVNTISTYNVFEASRRLGVKNVVWASSETVLGLPFDVPPPYIPVDENYPGRPESAYSLAKLMGETMAEQFCRWDREQKIFALRFSNVMEPKDYARFPDFEADPFERRWNLWGYIDVRDGAQAVRKALESERVGAEVFVIANAETVQRTPNEELVAHWWPELDVPDKLGTNESLLSIEKARRMLGYEPVSQRWEQGVPAADR